MRRRSWRISSGRVLRLLKPISTHLAGHGQIALYDQAIEYLIENGIPIPDHSPPLRAPRRRSIPLAVRSPMNISPGREQDLMPLLLRKYVIPGQVDPPIRRLSRFSSPNHSPYRTTATSCRGEPNPNSGNGRSSPKLLNPAAPYFDNADLLISADCVPFAYAGFHTEFLRDRIVIIFCPKLDSDIDGYIAKLAEIFSRHTIKSIMVAHMEVPCCSGVRYVVDKALEQSGKKIPVTEKTITIDGGVE